MKKNRFKDFFVRNPQDERITMVVDRITAPMYSVILGLSMLSIVVKLYFRLPMRIYALEISAILGSGLYLTVALWFKGLWFAEERDEYIKKTKAHFKCIAYYICFFIYIFGESVIIFSNMKNNKIFPNAAVYFLIWTIPSLILTVKYIKNGVLTWYRGKKAGLKVFMKSTVFGTLVFGILIGISKFQEIGKLNLKWICSVMFGTILWGAMTYFSMKWIFSKSEKIGDEAVKRAEGDGYEE